MDFSTPTMSSRTARVRTPLGNLYVTITRADDGRISRLTAHCGKEKTGGRWCNVEGAEMVSHPAVNGLLDCIAHLARKLMKESVPERQVAAMLMGYDDGWPIGYYYPAHNHDPVHGVKSLQDAIGRVINTDADKAGVPPLSKEI